jgi:hypothetical protein
MLQSIINKLASNRDYGKKKQNNDSVLVAFSYRILRHRLHHLRVWWTKNKETEVGKQAPLQSRLKALSYDFRWKKSLVEVACFFAFLCFFIET